MLGIINAVQDRVTRISITVNSASTGVFDDEANIVERGKGTAISFKQDIDALAVDTAAHEEEGEGATCRLAILWVAILRESTFFCTGIMEVLRPRFDGEHVRRDVGAEDFGIDAEGYQAQLFLRDAAVEVDPLQVLGMAPD